MALGRVVADQHVNHARCHPTERIKVADVRAAPCFRRLGGLQCNWKLTQRDAQPLHLRQLVQVMLIMRGDWGIVQIGWYWRAFDNSGNAITRNG